ncbi:AMP-binding protein [Sphingobium sp. TB-6]|uniref:class I adenylate-forming enzyme family protein n=1 Tax=Sphingobium sp. TB-6 TaxID=2728850 RepID=UPI00146C2677|nr:AMP-binding protein [Sphingobium sp. TB-6]NML91801.1 AMP-binding protein [Sphingobium sp. TB-6]
MADNQSPRSSKMADSTSGRSQPRFGPSGPAAPGDYRLPRDQIARCGHHYPRHPAYVAGDVSRSWGEMDARSDRIAAALQALGTRKGDAVGMLAGEFVEVYEHFFGCLKIGAIRVGINRRLAVRELIHVIRDARLTSLAVHVDCMPLLEKLRDAGGTEGLHLIGFGGKHDLSFDLETMIAQATEQPDYPDIDPEHPAFYSYTSGTTGLPKGVVLTQQGLVSSITHAVTQFGFNREDKFYHATSNAWVAIVLGMLGLANGMTTILPEGGLFELPKLLPDLAKHRATIALLAPTMLGWAIEEHRKGEQDLSALRLIAFGSSPSTPEMIRYAHEVFGCELLNCYAMTETTWGGISFLLPGDIRRGVADRPELLNSVGQISPLFDIAIRDEQGHDLPVGQAGEVWLRSEANMLCYLNLPDETADVLIDGWMRTNDVGQLDDEGYLYLLDRRKFMIISGGINVYPVVVEAALDEHGAIAESCVVGIAHPVWGEAVVAVVRLREGETANVDALRDFCRERLNHIQVPKHFHFVSEALPRTVTGKMQKAQVRQSLAAQPELFPWHK